MSDEKPFDIASLRIDPNAGAVPTQRILTTVAIRKPQKPEFVRVHPDLEWSLPCMLYTDRDDRDAVFVITPDVVQRAGFEVPAKRVVLVVAITRGGVPFLWPVPLPAADGRSSSWQTSAAEAARLAQTQWVRVHANMAAGVYELYAATVGVIPDPAWDALPPFAELVRIATKDRVVADPDHLVLRKLRGEV